MGVFLKNAGRGGFLVKMCSLGWGSRHGKLQKSKIYLARKFSKQLNKLNVSQYWPV